MLTSAHAIPFCGGLAKDIPVFAVGARTAAAARAAGFSAVRDGGGDAARLPSAIRQTLPDDAPLLHAAGRDRKAEPGRSLAESGRAVAVWECYAAESVPALPEEAVSALRARPVDAVLHYSRRSAAIAADLFAKATSPSARCAAQAAEWAVQAGSQVQFFVDLRPRPAMPLDTWRRRRLAADQARQHRPPGKTLSIRAPNGVSGATC